MSVRTKYVMRHRWNAWNMYPCRVSEIKKTEVMHNEAMPENNATLLLPKCLPITVMTIIQVGDPNNPQHARTVIANDNESINPNKRKQIVMHVPTINNTFGAEKCCNIIPYGI